MKTGTKSDDAPVKDLGDGVTFGKPCSAPSPELLDLLVCPLDHGKLAAEPEGLRCLTCKRVYPVIDGIPVMLPDRQLNHR